MVSRNRIVRRDRTGKRLRRDAESADQGVHKSHRSNAAFEAAIEDIGSRMKPDMIFISAGFDAHAVPIRSGSFSLKIRTMFG